MAGGTKRLTLDMGEKFDELLTKQAESASTSKAEFIRRAVATYAYLRNEAENGGKVSINAQDGTIKELVLS